MYNLYNYRMSEAESQPLIRLPHGGIFGGPTAKRRPMAMKTVRWGIIGCGDVTEVKSGPGFQKAAGSELVMVMRRNGAKAEDYARRHGVKRWTTDADAVIGDKEVDAVYIATPPGTHEFYAMKVLAAGKPCYVEKPMTRNAAEARRMVEAYKAKGVPLWVAYYRRAMPRFVKVKEILESGVLGELKMVFYSYRDGQMLERGEVVPWRLQPEHAGGGLFLDLGSHVLDLFDFFLGPLRERGGMAQNRKMTFDVEDNVIFSFDFGEHDGDLPCIGLWNFSKEGEKKEGFHFSGKEGGADVFLFRK